jgi:hypothetical protein
MPTARLLSFKPTFEMYGDWLLEQNRPEDALAQFEYALKRGPKRHLALKGKRQAAEMSGKEEMVAEVNEILAEIKTKAAGEGQEL